MQLLLGATSRRAIPFLMVLAFGVPFRFVSCDAGAVITTAGPIRARVIIMA